MTHLDAQSEAPRKRKKRWIWIVASAAVLVVGAEALIAASGSDPYAELRRFQPREIDVVPFYGGSSAGSRVKTAVLVFDPQDSLRVFRTMEEQLRDRHGFQMTEDPAVKLQNEARIRLAGKVNMIPLDTTKQLRFHPADLSYAKYPVVSSSDISPPIEEVWTFTKPGADDIEFHYGTDAAMDLLAYDHPKALGIMGGSSTPACYVLIRHEETWFERQVAAVRSWLRLN